MGGKGIFNASYVLSKAVLRIYPPNRSFDFGLTLTSDFTSASGQSLRLLWVQAAGWLTGPPGYDSGVALSCRKEKCEGFKGIEMSGEREGVPITLL